MSLCAPCEIALGQNAPQGVEKVHCECRIDIESSDHDDDSAVDGNDDSADDVMEPGTAFSTSYVEREGGVQ